MSDAHFDSTKKLLDPILNVFGGADGGIGFVKLRSFISQMKAKSIDPNDSEQFRATAFIECVERFSRLCDMMEAKL